MPRFGLSQSRKQRTHGQPVDGARMNPGKEGLGQICRRFDAETARHERPDGFVRAVAPGRDESFSTHPELAGPREELRLQERPDACGNTEDGRGRKREQAAFTLNVRKARRFRVYETRTESELLAQPDAFRFLDEQR